MPSTPRKLRAYQQVDLDAIAGAYGRLDRHKDPLRRILVVMGVSGGKTVLISHLLSALKHLPLDGKRMLVLVNTKDLVEQNASKIAEDNPALRVETETPKHKSSPTADVVVATFQV